MFPLALAIQIVFSGFEGASLERVETVSPTHFRCHVRGDVDQDGRNRQANWYYFRVDGAQNQAVTLDLVNLPGEYNYRANRGAVTKDTVPVWREEGGEWRHFEQTEYDAAEPRLRVRITPRKQRLWIAHVPAYTNRDLEALLRPSPWMKVESAGPTVEKRPIPLVTITDPAAPEAGKRVVWLMFRQHGWETGSSWAGEGAIRFLLSSDPRAQRIRREAIFKILPLCDPDGVARGNVRFNKFGFDLNRNWDVEDRARMPEIFAQRSSILSWVDAGKRLDLFLSVHNTETSEYLEAPPDREGVHRALGDRFFAKLREHTTFAPVRPLSWAGATTTEGKPGRMTVIQGLHRDRKLPAFLMEQMIARNPRLGRFPTAADRQAFGAALVVAMWETVRSQ